jgi:alpha-L-rhamnosidase
MKAWVDYVKADAGDDLVWSEGEHFGDWLAFASNRSGYPGATTGKDLIATAFFAHSADLVARAADVLGKNGEARKYRDLSESVKAAFRREFVSPNGRVGENTQTAYGLALAFDLLPEAQRATAARRLADDVRRVGHLTTGFVGTPLLMSSLTRYGYLDVAYELLLRDRYPSWLYPVTRGATTIWERWDGIRPDGSFQDPGMNSFNHYAFGAIGEWMVQVVAGIDVDPDRPGYKHTLIRPNPGGGFRKVSARYESLFGPVESTWEIAGGTMRLAVEIPPNTTGTVRLPGARVESAQEGGEPVTTAGGIVWSRQDGNDVILEVGSGRYQFVFPVHPPKRM